MTSSPLLIHTLFELAAYAIGVRVFLRQRRHLALPSLADPDLSLWLVVAAALGAAAGSKLAFWFEDPIQAFTNFPDWRHLLEGKSIVGGLLGGLVAVESCKKLLRLKGSTGDAFVLPLAIGMAIGRLGCFFAGLADHTYGNPTALPWGIDFGDGISRHPTQIYEIVFIALWTAMILRLKPAFSRSGDSFKVYLAGYLLFRLCVDAIKPNPMPYLFGLSGIQWLCVAGLAYYAIHLPRLARELSWDTR